MGFQSLCSGFIHMAFSLLILPAVSQKKITYPAEISDLDLFSGISFSHQTGWLYAKG